MAPFVAADASGWCTFYFQSLLGRAEVEQLAGNQQVTLHLMQSDLAPGRYTDVGQWREVIVGDPVWQRLAQGSHDRSDRPWAAGLHERLIPAGRATAARRCSPCAFRHLPPSCLPAISRSCGSTRSICFATVESGATFSAASSAATAPFGSSRTSISTMPLK